MINRSL